MKAIESLAVATALVGVMLAAGPSYAQVCAPCSPYSLLVLVAQSIVPGTTDIGNHCDDCTTTVALPFPVFIYGQGPFTTVNLSSNGTAQFVSNISPSTNTCLPSPSHETTIFPHWDDLMTDAQPGCSAYPGGACGIFTSLSGGIFNIEWRAVYAAVPTAVAHFELRLFANEDNFTIVIGTLVGGGASATAGAQCDTGTVFHQFSCNTPMQNNTALVFFCPLPVELTGFTVE